MLAVQQSDCASSLHAFLHHSYLCHHVPVGASCSGVMDCAIEVAKNNAS